ncbi:hypothetical protein K1719_042808 [Acacia pycnantha]|nr:hypothetical protein K1719_042808 [Acacia pycnantha]
MVTQLGSLKMWWVVKMMFCFILFLAPMMTVAARTSVLSTDSSNQKLEVQMQLKNLNKRVVKSIAELWKKFGKFKNTKKDQN